MRSDKSASNENGSAGAKALCPACQLQLCKGRDQPPHAALAEVEREQGAQRTIYACATCGTALVRSGDPRMAGWERKKAVRWPRASARDRASP